MLMFIMVVARRPETNGEGKSVLFWYIGVYCTRSTSELNRWLPPFRRIYPTVPWTRVLVMCCVKVFCETIRKVFLTWVPLYVKLFVQHLVCDPEKNAFPSTVIVIFSQSHSQFLLLCYCHSVLVLEVGGGPVC